MTRISNLNSHLSDESVVAWVLSNSGPQFDAVAVFAVVPISSLSCCCHCHCLFPVASGIEQRAGDRASVQRARLGARHALPAAHHGTQQRGPCACAVQLHHAFYQRQWVLLSSLLAYRLLGMWKMRYGIREYIYALEGFLQNFEYPKKRTGLQREHITT